MDSTLLSNLLTQFNFIVKIYGKQTEKINSTPSLDYYNLHQNLTDPSLIRFTHPKREREREKPEDQHEKSE